MVGRKARRPRPALEGENVPGCLLVELRDGTVPAGAGPAFRLGRYEVRRAAMQIEQRHGATQWG